MSIIREDDISTSWNADENGFDLVGWCKKNGFDFGEKLLDYGATDAMDLKELTEDDLISIGVTKPFIRKKFFLRANEEYSRLSSLNEKASKKEEAERQLALDINTLGQALSKQSITKAEYDDTVGKLRSTFLRLFCGGDGNENKTPVSINIGGKKAEMPINQETTVKDMKIFVGEKEKQDPRHVRLLYRDEEMKVKDESGNLNLITKYTGPELTGTDDIKAILPLSKHAGQSQITGAEVDAHNNAVGSQYDLGQADGFKGMTIVVFNCCNECSFTKPQKALEEMGFHVIEIQLFNGPQPVNIDSLRFASQIWVISSRNGHLNDSVYEFISSFYHNGRSVYIWGDNSPYFVEANNLFNRMLPGMSVRLEGDDPGGKVQKARSSATSSGFEAKHMIFTGIASLFEGITVSRVMKGSSEIEIIMNNSSGYPVTGVLDNLNKKHGRLAIDGAFTRLCNNWDDAGSARFVKNMAAWLAAIDSDWA
jgi:hypothetical protein